MRQFYHTKVKSKTFKFLHTLNFKHKALNILHNKIKNSIKKNLQRITKATPIIFLTKIIKKTIFNSLTRNIRRKYNENRLKRKTLQKLKTACIASHNLASARMAAIRKVSHRRCLKNAYKGLALLLTYHKKKVKALKSIAALFVNKKKREVLHRLKVNILRSIKRMYEMKKNIRCKRDMLKILYEISVKRIVEVNKYAKAVKARKVLSGLQYICCSKKLKVCFALYHLESTRTHSLHSLIAEVW